MSLLGTSSNPSRAAYVSTAPKQELDEQTILFSSTFECKSALFCCQDMVLLHHEVEVEFPDGQPAKKHKATLLEFGRTENGKTTTAMASTVGIPAAIGALLLLADKIKTRGVLRPIEPEVYVPALEILQAYGIKLLEKMD